MTATHQTPIGFNYGYDAVQLTNGSSKAAAIGDVFEIDPAVVSASYTLTEFTDVVSIEDGLFCVVMEAIAVGASGQCCVRGTIAAQTTGTPAVGAQLSVSTAEVLTGAAAASKAVGITLQTGTSTPTMVLFNGVEGIGYNET